MSLFDTLDVKVKELGGLIVSCQPVPGSPLDKPEIVAAMALAAVKTGVVAVRIEGINNLPDSPVRITPFLEDVDALAQAGADIIAFDGTDRPRPASVKATIERIHQQGCVAMADCSNLEDGTRCHALGAEIIGTTLSGYTTEAVPNEPDFPLVQALSAKGYRVIAEGRFNSPALAAQAIKQGAWAVTVGSAITRIEHICQWYRDALAEVAL